jgi:transposase
MYLSIHQLKNLGLNVSQIARKLGVSRNTVYKYLEMTSDQMHQRLEEMKTRKKKLDRHEQEILTWLREYPDLSAAQIFDWLKERYGDIQVSEGTVRNYVRSLRKKHNIPKEIYRRQYEAVEDPPMGEQMQVDFGETRMENEQGHWVKLWFMSFVLSHSRYKYVEWLDRPFTTVDVIQIHERAFGYFGGMPKEIVYDQDHLLLTSENHGDLIFTHEFARYVQQRGFRIYMCRKQDPESKGRVENVVKYVKQNFAKHRTFANLDALNEQCLAWLARTANGIVHHTTKKIPAEVFQEERKHLRPIQEKIQKPSAASLTRRVRKDNTILFEGNRYSVPLGTYDGPETSVGIQVTDEQELIIYDLKSKQEMARHPISQQKGKLIQNHNHKRDRSKGIDAYLQHVASLFPDPAEATTFLVAIREQKPRYIRDQLQLVEQQVVHVDKAVVSKALAYCIQYRLYRATDFVDVVKYYAGRQTSEAKSEETRIEIHLLDEVDSSKVKTKPQIRDIQVYQAILEGGKR